MPIEKKPLKQVSKDYCPPSSVLYKVKDGDSFISIAKHYNVEEWELIYENFRTRDTAEVNWYLRKYVGCKKQTLDGQNWIFSSDANPGFIHIPNQIIDIPCLVVPSKLKNVWAGIAKSHSGDLPGIGAHDLTGRVYNLGDELPDVRNAVVNINGFKFGLGLGGSIGAVFVIAYGYSDSYKMNGGVVGEWDFDLSIGAKLGDFLKGIKGIGKVIDTIQKYKKMRYLTENAIKNRGIVNPGIYAIPIPLAGVGLHAWVGFKFGDITIFKSGRGIP
ncbi:MAG: hypothetical protein GY705_05400 [Bacteroidetes bacterium]|nr:hypothetical protein [Bacteroidota bacterium]